VKLWKEHLEQITLVAMNAQQQIVAKPEITLVQLIASSFCVAATSGLARLLHSENELTRRRLCAAVLHSGMWGITVSLMWATFVSDDPLWVIGTASLAGFGVISLPKLTGTRFTVGGLSIEMKNSSDDWDARRDEDGSCYPDYPYDDRDDHDDDKTIWRG
jgi:hypothetical protein